jgi:hypothetical protein
MAIIQSDGSRPALDAIILASARPALDASTRPEDSLPEAGIWSDRIAAAWGSLQRAARAVGRVIPAERPRTGVASLPDYVATAFVVAPRLAVTADYVGDFLAKNRLPGSAKPLGWLDLDDVGAIGGPRLAVTGVYRVHPHWRFIFLTLDQDVDPEQILGIANVEAADQLSDRDICVIGFPADGTIGNDPAIVTSIFGNRFGIKRLMFGRALGMENSASGEFTPMILHDASTIAGTAGAPVIDLTSGLVLGINFAGQFGVANQAIPAWELSRDPQWAWLWTDTPRGELPKTPSLATHAATPTVIFPTQRLVGLHKLFVENGISTKIDILLNQLPPELSAELRNLEAPSSQDRLYAALASLNRALYLLEGTLPLEGVLLAAEALSFKLGQTKALKPYIEEAGHVRVTITARSG